MRQHISVLGGAQTKFGELWNYSLSDLLHEVISSAIVDTAIMPTDIDLVIVGNMIGGETAEQAHLGTIASGYLPHKPPALRVEAACASGGVAIHTACAMLESGRAETVLVIGAEKLTDITSEAVTKAIMHAGDSERDLHSGITFPGIFGLVASAYMNTYGLSRDELSLVSASSHLASVRNPYAQFRKEIPASTISKSALIADPLRLLDCSPITDGAAAIILSTKKESSIRIAASQIASDSVSLTQRESLTSFPSTRKAYQQAMKEAHWKNSDVDLLEIHDCFSIAALLHLEDMNFAEEGTAIQLYKEGDTKSTGSLPMNCSGGLKACGHPIGATGVKQVLDCYKQLKNIAPNQVPHARKALAHNMGGVGATAAVHLLECV